VELPSWPGHRWFTLVTMMSTTCPVILMFSYFKQLWSEYVARVIQDQGPSILAEFQPGHLTTPVYRDFRLYSQKALDYVSITGRRKTL